jgi:short-subunit dehydrogenase
METDDTRIRRAVEGKRIVITGASYGQGEATARLLARAGAHVMLIARTKDRLDQIVGEITDAGGTASSYALDISDMDAVDETVVQIVCEHGGVDILVHNAGKSLRRSVYRSAQRLHDMDAMVGVNFLGPMRLTLGLLPAMKANGGGHIVNVATAGLWLTPAAPRWSFYLGAKAGFDTWIRSVALETRNDGITLTSLYAGHIKSRMVATDWVARTPGHTPEQAARVVAYALTRRPRAMAPRAVAVQHILGTVLEGPMGAIMSRVDSRSTETAASAAAFTRALAAESLVTEADGRVR